MITRPTKVALAVAIALVAIVVAMTLDARVATLLRDSGFAAEFKKHEWLVAILKAPGHYFTVLLAATLLLVYHPWRWRASVLLLMCTVVSGINGLMKWIAGRTRPFKLPPPDGEQIGRLGPFVLEPFRGGLPGLLNARNLCFPSGHAALAFAAAAALAILLPRWRWAFYAGAALCAAERVLENAHWLSDAVAGAALGIGGTHLIFAVASDRVLRAGKREPDQHD